jgi:hypothetical protein
VKSLTVGLFCDPKATTPVFGGLTTTDGFVITTQDGFQIIQTGYDFQTQAGDAFEDNTEIELEGDSILDWTQIDPFSEGTA